MASSLDSNCFSPLGTFSVPKDTRLVPGACNPEKDLVLLIHHSETKDRDTLSLWKLQGSKRWEIDVAANFEHAGGLRQIAWSPDGDKFALGHTLKRVTVHSVLDGCEEFRYEDSSSSEGPKATEKMSAVEWVKMPWRYFWSQDISKTPPPQLYPRDYDPPGSAHYLFKQLSRLDHRERPIPSSAYSTEMGSAHPAPREVIDPSLVEWPTLPPNLLAASISEGPVDPSDLPPVSDPNERWNISQANTCLLGGDNHGTIFPFIHGTYRAGRIKTEPTSNHLMHIAVADTALYFTRFWNEAQGPTLGMLSMTGRIFEQGRKISISNSDYKLRDMLRISSTAFQLAKYAMESCETAKISWMGAPGKEGAREWNVKWTRVLVARQDPEKACDVRTDLTSLLLTGIPVSSALNDHLEHGSQTTERNLKKWHTAVRDALTIVKHQTELAVMGLQRLIAILWDLCGLAEIKSIALDFFLDKAIIEDCIKIAMRAIEMLVSLADVARREARGFEHFMSWLRGLIPNLPPADPPTQPYDLLLVNDYIAHGLNPSSIDAYFQPGTRKEGPLTVDPVFPSVSKMDDAMNTEEDIPRTFEEVASRALKALRDVRAPKSAPELSSPRVTKWKDSLSDTNVIAKIRTLVEQCANLFSRIAASITADSRSPPIAKDDNTQCPRERESGLHVRKGTEWKEIILPHAVKASTYREVYLQPPKLGEVLLRERLVANDTKIIQYIMLRLAEQHGRAQRICLIRLDHTSDPPTTQMVSCAMLDLMVLVGAEDGEDSTEEVQEIVGARLLDAQFYDDSQLVMVLQTAGATGRRSLAMLNYADVAYHEIADVGPSVNVEKDILRKYVYGELKAEHIALSRSRLIPNMKETVSLAVSSRRKVAVLLDQERWTAYAYDLSEDDGEEGEVAEESKEMEPSTVLDEEGSMAL